MTAIEHVDNPGLVEAARELIESLGVSIVLLHGVKPDGRCTCAKPNCASQGKHPRETGWKAQATKDLQTVTRWVGAYPYLNLGWIPGNQYLVVDVDPRNGGINSYQQMRAILPATRTHITGGAPVDGQQGRHAIYRRPPGIRINQTGKIAPGIDFKTGDGSLLVAPGSRTHGPYLIVHAEGIEPLPDRLLEKILGVRVPTNHPAGTGRPRDRVGEPIVFGSREQELISYAGDLARRVNRGEVSTAEAPGMMRLRWEDCETKPYGDNVPLEKALGMVDRMLARDVQRDVLPQEPVDDPTMADGYWANDIGNAHRLLDYVRGRAKWVDTWSSWVVYHDGVWRIDANRVLMLEMAAETIVGMRQKAALLPKQAREALWKWANESSKARNLEAMVKMTRGNSEIFIDHHALNQHPHLLNVLNGTIDLQTNDILPHSPGHLLTTQAAVEYDPDAKCPMWDQQMLRCQPDDEVRWFLQKAVGSGLIGHAVQHLFINHGTGSNGKGIFYNTIAGILGDDYYTIPHQSLITLQKHSQHDTVKASLYGARMAVAAETAEQDKLNEAQVKELTGGDTLRARRMRENEWSFRPTYTMFLHTNHKPHIRGNDEGIWRRIFLIPWEVTIPEHERDDQFKETLLQERSGILNWMLAGCAGYLLEGFNNPPEKVRQATAEYRHESDVIGRFFAHIGLKREVGGFESSADLQRKWQLWTNAEGFKMPLLWREVADRIIQLGGEDAKPRVEGKQVRGYRGVSCIPGVNAPK